MFRNFWLAMIKANSGELGIIDHRKIGNADIWAHLASAGNELYVRDLEALVGYRWKKCGSVAFRSAKAARRFKYRVGQALPDA